MAQGNFEPGGGAGQPSLHRAIPRKVGEDQMAQLIRAMEEVHWDALPNNRQKSYTAVLGTASPTLSGDQKIAAGTVYDYPFPVFTRDWKLFNASQNAAGSTYGGNLYYWFNAPFGGKTVNVAGTVPTGVGFFDMLGATTPFTNRSVYQMISVMADSSCTDPGWTLRFEGRLPGDLSVGPVEGKY